MWSGFPLFPEQASTLAGQVDGLFFFLLGVTAFFSLLIAGLIVVFMFPQVALWLPELLFGR